MKNELISKLAKLRSKIEAENRFPNTAENAQARDWLDQLEEIESREMFSNQRPAIDTDVSFRTPIDTEAEQAERRNTGRFSNLGEQLIAVRNAVMPGGKTDHRLYKIMERRAATGLSEGIPSDGGFLVDQDLSSMLLQNLWDNSEILKRINLIPISGNSNGIKLNGFDETSRADGSRAGGIRAYWKNEADEKTASKPKFRQVGLNLNKLIGLCYGTDELLQDANALGKIITDGFRAEFDFKLVDAIINGTGAGQPLGILNAGCVVTVSAEGGQAADTIIYENVNKMWARFKMTDPKKSAWIINQDCLPSLGSMSLAVGTGGVPVYMPAGGVSGLPYGTLFGLPVIMTEQNATVGDTGDILLCDFSQYIAIDKGGLQRDVSIHVRYIYDESVNAADDYYQLKKAA